MGKYNKFIVAGVGAFVTFVTLAYNSPEWLTTLVPILTALGVYQVPNEKG